jgi:ParB-like chromosome segregation protein Spo0J
LRNNTSTVFRRHHRYEAGKIAGITEVVVKVYVGLGEEGKQEVAHKNNTLTREISRDEKIEKAVKLRKEGRSYRQIGDWLGVHFDTVRRWVSHVEVTTPEKTEGSDGKQYSPTQATVHEKQQRRERVKELREQGSKIAEIASKKVYALKKIKRYR